MTVADELMRYLRMAQVVPGWIRGPEAEELMRASFLLDREPSIVEIGSFFGRSTILLAGPRRLQGSGTVHCVDPFDCSGDAFSVPHYESILEREGGGSLLDRFRANIERAGLSDYVEVHRGTAPEIANRWSGAIDMLLLDGDQSPKGAREAYESWAPFLKPGGVIVLRNTSPHNATEGHDGHRRLVVEEIVAPKYAYVRQMGATTFARKMAVLER